MSRVVHFEIHAENPERALRFYADLFGWQFTQWPGPQPYWLIKTGAPGEPGIDGGLLPRRGAGPAEGQAVNSYVCTISTTALDRDLDLVCSKGGAIAVTKMAIPGVGWLAYAKDTEGNLFGLMQNDPRAK